MALTNVTMLHGRVTMPKWGELASTILHSFFEPRGHAKWLELRSREFAEVVVHTLWPLRTSLSAAGGDPKLPN